MKDDRRDIEKTARRRNLCRPERKRISAEERQDLVNKYRRYVLEGVVDFKSKGSQGE